MNHNRSPWIEQLHRTRSVTPLEQSLHTDVVVIGGGIAGISTLYFLLTMTDKKVVLLEGKMIGHGATGHNAGQIASYSERSFSSIVQEFGLAMAAQGQKDTESAWDLIDTIIQNTEIDVPWYKFTGYAGLSQDYDIVSHLENNYYRKQGGLLCEEMYIHEQWAGLATLDIRYQGLYTVISAREIKDLLETKDTQYQAVLAYQKGCMNSALFVERLIEYLIKQYPDRLRVYEHSPVAQIFLGDTSVECKVHDYTVQSESVVLCTNGFQHFEIMHMNGVSVPTHIHHDIAGRIGYMAGYKESMVHAPVAMSFFPVHHAHADTATEDPTGEAYYYLTRRPYHTQGIHTHNLVCIGGPDRSLPNTAYYDERTQPLADIELELQDFLGQTYRHYPSDQKHFDYSWHGLMGYTPNGLRKIGPEPTCTRLLYNLGCNGVGILPSVFGGYKITRHIRGDQVESSIFDPLV